MNIIIQDFVPAIILCLIAGFIFIIILISALISVILMSRDIRRIADSLSRKSDTGEPRDGEVSL